MFSQLKESKKVEKSSSPKKISDLKSSNLNIDLNDCKQAILLPDGTYCGKWKEKVNEVLCKACPYFDLEPLEYKLFKRI